MNSFRTVPQVATQGGGDGLVADGSIPLREGVNECQAGNSPPDTGGEFPASDSVEQQTLKLDYIVNPE